MLNFELPGFTIQKQLHIGTHSSIYDVVSLTDNKKYVFKLKELTEEESLLGDCHTEAKVLKSIESVKGFPKLFKTEVKGKVQTSLLESLGPSLDDLLFSCGGRFTLKTTLLLFDQMLSLVKTLHQKGYVHGNIKPNHFLLGNGDRRDVVYLIDFANARNMASSKDQNTLCHLDFDFASASTLANKQPTLRDDIESLTYVMIYFLCGKFPWTEKLSDIQSKEESENTKGDINSLKQAYFTEKKYIPAELLCFGLPGNITSRTCTISELHTRIE